MVSANTANSAGIRIDLDDLNTRDRVRIRYRDIDVDALDEPQDFQVFVDTATDDGSFTAATDQVDTDGMAHPVDGSGTLEITPGRV